MYLPSPGCLNPLDWNQQHDHDDRSSIIALGKGLVSRQPGTIRREPTCEHYAAGYEKISL